MDDLSAVRKAIAGDESAFELLVRRHIDAVWRLARSILGTDFEAEEAVQDTFVKAYRSLGSFRAEATFRTWLRSICYRACLDQLRARHADVVPLAKVRNQQSEERVDVDLRLVLEMLLRQLPPEEREAFVLVHVLKYTREEAATISAVPPSTMRARVTRARERLAELLRGADIEENDA